MSSRGGAAWTSIFRHAAAPRPVRGRGEGDIATQSSESLIVCFLLLQIQCMRWNSLLLLQTCFRRGELIVVRPARYLASEAEGQRVQQVLTELATAPDTVRLLTVSLRGDREADLFLLDRRHVTGQLERFAERAFLFGLKVRHGNCAVATRARFLNHVRQRQMGTAVGNDLPPLMQEVAAEIWAALKRFGWQVRHELPAPEPRLAAPSAARRMAGRPLDGRSARSGPAELMLALAASTR